MHGQENVKRNLEALVSTKQRSDRTAHAYWVFSDVIDVCRRAEIFVLQKVCDSPVF